MERISNDFLMQLTNEEWNDVITNCDNLGALRYSPVSPYAFAEQVTFLTIKEVRITTPDKQRSAKMLTGDTFGIDPDWLISIA